MGTEIPYPSSQTEKTTGICKTPAALILSKNIPSDVEASPMEVKQTSLPSLEKPDL